MLADTMRAADFGVADDELVDLPTDVLRALSVRAGWATARRALGLPWRKALRAAATDPEGTR